MLWSFCGFYLIKCFVFDKVAENHYFTHIKNSYRSTSLLDKKIKETENNLVLLKNDTENIIEFVEYKCYIIG